MGISTEPSISELSAGVYTWATLPAATAYAAGTQARVTDVGAAGAGSLWVSTGSVWVPENGHILVAQSAVAVTAPANDTNENVLATVTIPGGVIGANGALRITPVWSYTNSGNIKTLRVRLGGTQIGTAGPTTTATLQSYFMVRNRNDEASQVSSVLGAGAVSSASAVTTTAVNTAADVSLTITAQKATGSETVTLEGYNVELMRI